MKIAILYIGIGKYSCFWKDFYSSCENLFMPGIEKHYFVVSDSESHFQGVDNLTYIHQEDLKWPCNVLFKYMFFLRIKEELKKYDMLFLCNANIRFQYPISPNEILPQEDQGGLVMLTWQNPDTDPDQFPFERRDISSSYIPYGTRQMYFQAGFYGGEQDKMLKLFEACHEVVMKDFCNGIVPIWHDESVLNKCMLGRKCKVLDCVYGQPEHRDKNHSAKIVFRDKEKVLGRSFMRNFKKRKHSNSWLRRLLRLQ